jgi:hypothetical protein
MKTSRSARRTSLLSKMDLSLVGHIPCLVIDVSYDGGRHLVHPGFIFTIYGLGNPPGCKGGRGRRGNRVITNLNITQ